MPVDYLASDWSSTAAVCCSHWSTSPTLYKLSITGPKGMPCPLGLAAAPAGSINFSQHVKCKHSILTWCWGLGRFCCVAVAGMIWLVQQLFRVLNVSVQPLGNSRAVFCGKFLDMGSDESKNRLGNCSLLGWAAQYISSKSCYELKKGNTNQPYSRTN